MESQPSKSPAWPSKKERASLTLVASIVFALGGAEVVWPNALARESKRQLLKKEEDQHKPFCVAIFCILLTLHNLQT